MIEHQPNMYERQTAAMTALLAQLAAETTTVVQVETPDSAEPSPDSLQAA